MTSRQVQIGLVPLLINRFRSRTTSVAFTNINKQTFINELEQRVRNPASIGQGKTSLCGPAAFMYCLAKLSPLTYANYAINLYEKGVAQLGDLTVKPGKNCKNNTPSIAGVDWVTLAGLRDSENTMFDYKDKTNEFSGVTFPSHIVQWFEKIGFEVKEKANIWFDKDLKCLLNGLRHYKSGKMVCLFVGANVLLNRDGSSTTPDHWVVLSSDIRIDGNPANGNDNSKELLQKTIDFNVFTWANERTINRHRSSHMTVETFLEYFYGFIAVGYPKPTLLPHSDFHQFA